MGPRFAAAAALLACLPAGMAALTLPSAAAETPSNFKLYETQNVWNQLLLDTRDGRVWQVQFSTSSENRVRFMINTEPLAGKLSEPGRFSLEPTQDMWTFLMLDQATGRVWQLQYSISEEMKRGIIPIPDQISRDRGDLTGEPPTNLLELNGPPRKSKLSVAEFAGLVRARLKSLKGASRLDSFSDLDVTEGVFRVWPDYVNYVDLPHGGPGPDSPQAMTVEDILRRLTPR